MLATKIEYIIGLEGYSMNTWSPFDAFSIFFLERDNNCYTDKNSRRWRFNTSNSCLECVLGKTREDGTFVTYRGETDPANFVTDEFYSFETIHGMIKTVSRFGNNSYFKR